MFFLLNRKKLKNMGNTIIYLILTVIAAYSVFAQCDCPGNIPAPMIISSGPINNGKLLLYESDLSLNLSYRYSYGDKQLSGDHENINTYKTKYNFNYFGLLAVYGLSNRINLDAEAGFYSSNVSDFYREFKFNRFSHLSLNLKYNIFDSDFTDEFIVGVGLKMPLNNQDIDTVHYFKPNNSTFGTSLSAIYNYVLNSEMNLIFNAKYDYNFKDSKNSKFGNVISTGITYRYKLSSALNCGLGLSYEHRNKDLFEDKSYQYSGGDIAIIAPSLTYKFDFPMYVNLSVPFPVYQYYNGVQTAMKYSLVLSAGLSL